MTAPYACRLASLPNRCAGQGAVAFDRCRCTNPRGLAVSVAQPNDCEGGKHNDRRAWGETRCSSQTQTSQDHLGWGVGRWCGLGAGSWPWHWARRVGLGLAAALIGTSALSTLIPHPLVHCALACATVCGCILTRKPRKKPPTETLRPAVPDEHQPAVSVSKKKGALIGRAAGERYRPLKKPNQVCNLRG